MSITELIAKAIDHAFLAEDGYWFSATVDYAPDGTETVVVTADPDFGRTIRLAVKEIQP